MLEIRLTHRGDGTARESLWLRGVPRPIDAMLDQQEADGMIFRFAKTPLFNETVETIHRVFGEPDRTEIDGEVVEMTWSRP